MWYNGLNTPAVPRRWPASTIILLGSGPSLTADDVDRCRAIPNTAVLAISDTYRLAPWADVLYSPDARWWEWHQDALALPCRKFAIQTVRSGVTRIAPGHRTLLETDPHYLSTGGHGGWQAINLAVHLGAASLILLGYDMQPDPSNADRHHFFGEHPNNTHVRYSQWLPLYDDLPRQLAAVSVTVVNATRSTAIRTVPRVSLAAAIDMARLRSASAAIGVHL